MIQMSVRKDSANKKELVEAYAKVIDNLDEYKKVACITAQEKEQYETSYMVEQYIGIVKEISGS